MSAEVREAHLFGLLDAAGVPSVQNALLDDGISSSADKCVKSVFKRSPEADDGLLADERFANHCRFLIQVDLKVEFPEVSEW